MTELKKIGTTESVSLVMKKTAGHIQLIERKDDTDWIKGCTEMVVEGVRQRRCSRKTQLTLQGHVYGASTQHAFTGTC